MFNSIKTAVLAAAVVAAAPAMASAQTLTYSAAPVSVTSCTASDNTSLVGPITMGGQLIHSSNDIDLSYVNNGAIPAASVTFLVNDGNRTNSIVARGNFAPGTTISQTFTANADGAIGAAACTVAAVRFVDGSVWNAGTPSVVGAR